MVSIIQIRYRYSSTAENCGKGLVFIVFVLPVNLLTLLTTIAFCPILVPVYLVIDVRLFRAFKSTWTKYYFCNYWTFKYTLRFCYWLLSPIWFLPWLCYRCCKKSCGETSTESTHSRAAQPVDLINQTTSRQLPGVPSAPSRSTTIQSAREPELEKVESTYTVLRSAPAPPVMTTQNTVSYRLETAPSIPTNFNTQNVVPSRPENTYSPALAI